MPGAEAVGRKCKRGCASACDEDPGEERAAFQHFRKRGPAHGGFVRALHLLNIKIPYTFRKYLPAATDFDFDDKAELPSPPNLLVLDCPTSTLTPEALAQDVHRTGADIVIVNSLEYAAFSDRRRKELAEGILDIRHRRGTSFFVFTHFVKAMVPYVGGRGSIGLLSAFSKSIWYLLEEWERNAWTNSLLKQLEQLDGSV